MTLRIGQQAPDFHRTTHEGESINLASFQGEKAVVLYFYPKDETPGCTAEACSFRDAYEDFTDAGAIVIGVSPDSADSHEKFAAHHRLPFKLISDESGELRRSYDVPKAMLGMLPGRVTYVIDKQGKVQHVFNSMLKAKRHVTEALSVVKRLAG
ncbi:peroxiredoxin [Enhygromyxa salina]|uniref:thioredoxin-dependent peroxiredoxin n=1 Tax=Enhygromyxa salina TaxID=215803 RepID=A0A2S9Y2K5_9BACT|nr:peroxiredoxin [Enhygromyxa salina]PRP99338.1 putative peroxiredoxin bcp [Enhygromyxa salina]